MSITVEGRLDPRAIYLDLAERIIVSLLLALLASRLLPSVMQGGSFQNLILLVSEAMVVLFILFRRPARTISLRPMDWVLGFTGTFLPLLAVAAGPEPLAPGLLVFALMTGGFLFQLWAKLVLRRSFGVVAANRGVKASGPYRIVRHPMYAGYIVTQVGFLLSGPVLWNVVLYAVLWCILVARIRAEEQTLIEDPAYQELTRQVRYRLIPFVY